MANQSDRVTALVMTVKHGLVGQKLMKDMTRKVHWLRTQFPSLDTEVDGGVGPDTIHKCAEAGANTIVSGSAIMKSEDPRSMINSVKDCLLRCSEAAQKCFLDRWNHKEPSVPAMRSLLEDKNTDHQITPQLRQCCFSEKLVIPVTKIHHEECSKKLETVVYNYIFSDGIERLVW